MWRESTQYTQNENSTLRYVMAASMCMQSLHKGIHWSLFMKGILGPANMSTFGRLHTLWIPKMY